MIVKKLLIVLAILLVAVLCSEARDIITARRQFRNAIEKNPAAARQYLQDPDPEIRRYALYTIIKDAPEKHLYLLTEAIQDQDIQVRFTAVKALRMLSVKNPQAKKILAKYAIKDKDESIRQIGEAASWPFQREIKLLRNDPSWDHEIRTVKEIGLANLPWKMQKDSDSSGHLQKWFNPNYDVSKWLPAQMGYFEKQGFPDYDGIVWYRIEFDMPSKIESNAVEVSFGAVDESAWVWMNGIYLGAHDKGLAGWDTPFDMDCTREIRWGKKNVLVVRVRDTCMAGGIWKPVSVKVLK